MIESQSFIAGQSLPPWAKSKGVREVRDKEGNFISLIVPTGVGTHVKKASEGDTVAFVEDFATVIPKDVANSYKG